MSVLPAYLVRGALAHGRLRVLHSPEVPPLNVVYLAARTGDLERLPVLREAAGAIRAAVSAF